MLARILARRAEASLIRSRSGELVITRENDTRGWEGVVVVAVVVVVPCHDFWLMHAVARAAGHTGEGGQRRGVYVTDVTGPRFCRFCMRAYNGVARKNNATTNVGRNTGRSNGVRTYAGHEGRRRLRMLRDNCSENIYASYRSNGTVETVDDPACVNARPRTKTGIAGVFPLRSASDRSEFVKRLAVNFNPIPLTVDKLC